MAQKTLSQGVHAPIFDRFIDANPAVQDESSEHYLLTNDALKKSIYNWLYIVFNTRPSAKDYLSHYDDQNDVAPKLPIYFGLSDFAWFDTSDHLNLGLIAHVIEEVIARYEPRLTNVNVIIISKNNMNMGISIRINATIKMANDQERVYFPFIIENIFKRS